ncbi:MAG: GNAT family N-acetyltransferase [Minisyncoccia bacterium]
MKVCDHVNFGEWQEIAEKCDYATFFHTPAWSKVFAKTYPKMSIETKKIIFDDGKAIIFPLVRRKAAGIFDTYSSNIAGVYGGWIARRNISKEQIDLVTEWANKNFSNFTWRINPFDHSLKGLGDAITRKDFTQYIDLRQGFDHIYEKWTRGHASAVKKAQKDGVTVKQADSWAEWEKYFEIYQDSIKRWGKKTSSRYPLELFGNLFQEKSENIKLWLAYFDKKPIGGALCLYNNHHVDYWHGAALVGYFKRKPSNLLQYEIIKNACGGGYWWYDFNPSGGHEGVIRFKKSFGAEMVSADIISKEERLKKTICSLLNNIKRIR